MIDHGWQRSSFCAGGGNNCLELAVTSRGVALRESLEPNSTLVVRRAALGALLASLKDGMFDKMHS